MTYAFAALLLMDGYCLMCIKLRQLTESGDAFIPHIVHIDLREVMLCIGSGLMVRSVHNRSFDKSVDASLECRFTKMI